MFGGVDWNAFDLDVIVFDHRIKFEEEVGVYYLLVYGTVVYIITLSYAYQLNAHFYPLRVLIFRYRFTLVNLFFYFTSFSFNFCVGIHL